MFMALSAELVRWYCAHCESHACALLESGEACSVGVARLLRGGLLRLPFVGWYPRLKPWNHPHCRTQLFHHQSRLITLEAFAFPMTVWTLLLLRVRGALFFRSFCSLPFTRRLALSTEGLKVTIEWSFNPVTTSFRVGEWPYSWPMPT